MDDKRKEKLGKDLDLLEENLKHTPMAVRLMINEDSKFKYVLMGGMQFNPKWLYFYELPEFISEKLALLKMLNRFEEIPDVGKRFDENTYRMWMRPAVWESIEPLAVASKSKHDIL